MLVLIVAFALASINENREAGWALLSALYTAMAARILLSRVRVSNAGITVHNPIRRYEIAWSQIDGFSMDQFWLLLKTGVAHLKDGTSVRLWGLPYGNRARSRDRATRYIAELNELLSRYTH